ncbi:hypothetical protein G6F56_010655 [Rhizopus delemar]|nr:hypothetical protein G6F56_010655 [Rhizopus delemar]
MNRPLILPHLFFFFIKKTEAIAAGIVVGSVTEAILRNTEIVSTIEEIIQKSGNVSIEIVTDKPTDKIITQEGSTVDSKVGIIVKEVDVIDVEQVKQVQKAPVDVTAIVASAVIETIAKNKNTASKVDTLIGESELVNVEITAGTTVVENIIDVAHVFIVEDEQVKNETVSIPEAITAGIVASGVVSTVIGNEKISANIDTIVQESGSVGIELVTEDVETVSQVGIVIKDSAPVGTKATKKDKTSVGVIVAGSIVGSVLENEKTSSIVGTTAQGSDVVSIQIISGDEKAHTVVDTTVVTSDIEVIEKIVSETQVTEVEFAQEPVTSDSEVKIAETITKESNSKKVTAVDDKKTSHINETTKPIVQDKKTEKAIATAVAGTVGDIISKNNDTKNTVKKIVEQSGVVNVDVIVNDDKKTGKPVKDSQIEVIVNYQRSHRC